MRTVIILLLIYSMSPLVSKAQTEKLRQSKWIKIMENETTGNYFEADNDFQKFYASYLEKKSTTKEEQNNAATGEDHLESPVELFIASYLKWSIGIKPFVLPDGSIMPIEQRMIIINEARKNNASNSR